MKKCPKCGKKYIDDISNCPSCNIALEECKDTTSSELMYQNTSINEKINAFINNYISKMKVYHAAIIYISLIVIVFISYLCGTAKKYDNTYITKTFQIKKTNFEALTKQQNIYDEHKSTQESLNSEITNLQKQIDAITDFEEKQDSYNSELQNLSDQLNDLMSQKTQKKNQLNEIEYEISQY